MGKYWDQNEPLSKEKRFKQETQSSTPRTDEERREILQKKIIDEARKGWRVHHESSFFVALVKGKRPNHILHLLLSIVTFGFWLPVWLILGISMGERTQTIEIDKFGNSIYR